MARQSKTYGQNKLIKALNVGYIPILYNNATNQIIHCLARARSVDPMKNILLHRVPYSSIGVMLFVVTVSSLLFLSYLPGSDEYLQAQAALNLISDLGYTYPQHLQHLLAICDQECEPRYILLSSWPPGLTALLLPLALIFNINTAIIITKVLSIVVAYLAWKSLLLSEVFNKAIPWEINLVTIAFLTMIAFQSTTDVYLATYVPFTFAIYKNLSNNEITDFKLLIFNLITAFALLMKYQTLFIALPFYILLAISFIWHGHNKKFLSLMAGSTIPIFTVLAYLLMNYKHTGALSRQMIEYPKTSTTLLETIANLNINNLYSYLDAVFFEAFILPIYIEKFLISLQIPHSVFIGLKSLYYIIFFGILCYMIYVLMSEKKIIYLKFLGLILFSNTFFLLALHIFFVSDDPDFFTFTYYRYYTFIALFLLIFIIKSLKKLTTSLSMVFAIIVATFSISLVSIKTIEANEAFQARSEVRELIDTHLTRPPTNLLLTFFGTQIWRTDWSTRTSYRYLTRDFLYLPQKMKSDISVILVCSKNNRGILGQINTDGCRDVSLYKNKFVSLFGDFQLIDAEKYIILYSLN